MHDFRKLKVWQQSIDLAQQIFLFSKNLPSEEKYNLTSQLNRCAISISSNIAEGSSRSKKEFKRFLDISLGSAYEMETQLIIAERFKYIGELEFNDLIYKVQKIQRMIVGFKNSLN